MEDGGCSVFVMTALFSLSAECGANKRGKMAVGINRGKMHEIKDYARETCLWTKKTKKVVNKDGKTVKHFVTSCP